MQDDLIKFSLPEIILGSLLTLSTDAIRIMSDFSLAIPVLGVVLAGLASIMAAVTWAIILFWFVSGFQIVARVKPEIEHYF